jgi:hypothetical protein
MRRAQETLTLDPLPCWKDLSDEERYRRAAALAANPPLLF